MKRKGDRGTVCNNGDGGTPIKFLFSEPALWCNSDSDHAYDDLVLLSPCCTKLKVWRWASKKGHMHAFSVCAIN